MDIQEINELVSKGAAATDATREESSDMLVFGRINQNADDLTQSASLKFLGQFDLVKSKRNKIVAEMISNLPSVDFRPTDGATDDDSKLMDGLFRSDVIDGEEAFETAVFDQVDCGYGAFRLTTEYIDTLNDLDNKQRIKFSPINEANNVVYFDPNSKRKDKRDARWCAIITPYSKDGWKQYCKENGIDYSDNENPMPFKAGNQSVNFRNFWQSSKDEIKIAEFYYREKKRERVFIYESPISQEPVAYYQREIKDVAEELSAAGYFKVGEKYKERHVVYKLLVTGDKIIKKQRIAGQYIPVIPVYGDWSITEGREIWRGIYHDAQDAQRLHNMLMSYQADIVARGPRQTPILAPDQIKGFEFMYQENGPDSEYPYVLQNLNGKDGNPLPMGPLGYLEQPQVPQAVAHLTEGVRRAVDDVTGGTASQEQMMNGQVTEGQIAAFQKAQNMETFLYQNSLALAMKQCGRVYASMAKELYDTPREVAITLPDGTQKQTQIMESVIDEQTGEPVVLRDITRGAFEIYVDTGPSYQTQREETVAKMTEIATALQGTELGQIAMLVATMNMEGAGLDVIRDYSRKQLVLGGYMKPETDEEKMMLQQAQMAAQNQQDPNMIFAQAEQMKAQSDLMDSQLKAQTEQAKLQLAAEEAETKRMKTIAEIQKMQADTEIKETDLASKIMQALQPKYMGMVQ